MYGYEIYFDNNMVREDNGFDSYDEAFEDAVCTVKYDLCEEWEDTTEKDYEIVIKE